jgi:acylphosphatase
MRDMFMVSSLETAWAFGVSIQAGEALPPPSWQRCKSHKTFRASTFKNTRTKNKRRNEEIYCAFMRFIASLPGRRKSSLQLRCADNLPLPHPAPDSVGDGDGDETMNETNKTASVRILGRVQGVSFRVWARDEAQKLGLVGWVRNEADGSVAALISGPEEAVTRMLERLHEGPPAAWVSKVVTEFVEAPEGVSGFRITR